MKMKPISVFAISIVTAVFFSTSAIAAESSEADQPPGKGKMGMMHKDTMVASSDGGVIVLSGMRYLNTIKT